MIIIINNSNNINNNNSIDNNLANPSSAGCRQEGAAVAGASGSPGKAAGHEEAAEEWGLEKVLSKNITKDIN